MRRQGRKGDNFERRCLGCRGLILKPFLLRVVRRPEGTVVIDKGQKLMGRGAYVCPIWDCLIAAYKRHQFRWGLRIKGLTDGAEKAIVKGLMETAVWATGDLSRLWR